MSFLFNLFEFSYGFTHNKRYFFMFSEYAKYITSCVCIKDKHVCFCERNLIFTSHFSEKKTQNNYGERKYGVDNMGGGYLPSSLFE